MFVGSFFKTSIDISFFVEFHGHLIPKGSVLFLNIHDSHHDPKNWIEPETFNPDRFLSMDENGVTKLIHSDALMPFGSGKYIIFN